MKWGRHQRKMSVNKAEAASPSFSLLLLMLLAAIHKTESGCPPQCSAPVSTRLAREEYKVLLDNCGPPPRRGGPPPIMASPIITKPIVEPTRVLKPPSIPRPQVVSHKCFCVKTMVRPRVFRRVIVVPQMMRFLKKTYRPVIEKVPFYARPVKALPARSCPGAVVEASANPLQRAAYASLNQPSDLRAIQSFVF